MTLCNLAPIAFFTYNRAEHARRAIESLLTNKEAASTDLFIFSDGAKDEKDARGVAANRRYIHTVKGFRSVQIIEKEHNMGLANSLIAGITDVVNRYGRVIVVEDDLIVSPYFLKYMNDALEFYKEDGRISAISAFLNPVKGRLPETFFLQYFACWGWGTWKRGWDLLNPDAEFLRNQFKNYHQFRRYDIDFSNKFYRMVEMQAKGCLDSWACRFYASSFLAGKLILFPGRSMAAQTGMDGTGVHCGTTHLYDTVELSQEPIQVRPIPVKVSSKAYRAFRHFYFWSLPGRRNKVKSLLALLGLKYRQFG